MNTINTNPQQSASNKTVKNIVDMFNQLTPNNKDIVLNYIRQMVESNVPKQNTENEIPTAKKNSSSENSFISALYSSIIEDKRIYKPLMDLVYSESELEDIKDRWGITDATARFEFNWLLSDYSAQGEHHGFEQGLKIGMKLAAFAFNGSDE